MIPGGHTTNWQVLSNEENHNDYLKVQNDEGWGKGYTVERDLFVKPCSPLTIHYYTGGLS